MDGKKPVYVVKLFLGTTPHAVIVTTRIITFLIGNPYKPSFVTVTGWGIDRNYSLLSQFRAMKILKFKLDNFPTKVGIPKSLSRLAIV